MRSNWRIFIIQTQLNRFIPLESKTLDIRNGTSFIEQNGSLFLKIISFVLFNVHSSIVIHLLVGWFQENPLASDRIWVIFFTVERSDLEEARVHGTHHHTSLDDSLTGIECSAEVRDSEDLLDDSLDIWDSGGSSDYFNVLIEDLLLL